MNLEDIMLSERRQSHKNKYSIIPLTWGFPGGTVIKNIYIYIFLAALFFFSFLFYIEV